MSCGIFGKLQVAVDHEGCEEKRQINDRGDEKALGRSVSVLSESEIKRSQHDEKSQCNRTEKIEVSGRFVPFPQIEKVGCKDQKVKDESVDETLSGELSAVWITGMMKLKTTFFIVFPKIPRDGHEVRKLPSKKDPKQNPTI